MRGAVSLAAALAVPLSVDARPQIIFLSFALILVTLVGQGLSLPFIVRALKLEEPRRWSDEEAVARMEAAQSALDRIDQMEDEERADEHQLGACATSTARASGCARRCSAARTPRPPPASSGSPTTASLRRELIGIEREELLSLRGEGRLRNTTMRQIERDLDLEEARIGTSGRVEESGAPPPKTVAQLGRLQGSLSDLSFRGGAPDSHRSQLRFSSDSSSTIPISELGEGFVGGSGGPSPEAQSGA